MDFLPGDATRSGRVDAFDTLGIRARQGSVLPSSGGGGTFGAASAPASLSTSPAGGANLVTRLKDEGVLA
jgi:hypothetical protein